MTEAIDLAKHLNTQFKEQDREVRFYEDRAYVIGEKLYLQFEAEVVSYSLIMDVVKWSKEKGYRPLLADMYKKRVTLIRIEDARTEISRQNT